MQIILHLLFTLLTGISITQALTDCNLVPRTSHCPVFDCLQYAKTGKQSKTGWWEVLHGNEASEVVHFYLPVIFTCKIRNYGMERMLWDEMEWNVYQ